MATNEQIKAALKSVEEDITQHNYVIENSVNDGAVLSSMKHIKLL